jgi:hypothetical protein
MDRKTLTKQARRHWEEFLPKTTQRLKESGQFGAAIREAATRAHGEIMDLAIRGYPLGEAEKQVLPNYIFLKPEMVDGEH